MKVDLDKLERLDMPALSRKDSTFQQQSSAQLRLYPTFQENKGLPVHRWFSYTEGFSGNFVREALSKELHSEGLVLDPFCGTSTTGLEAVVAGHRYHGYDINPVMQLISKTKTVHAFKMARKIQLRVYSFESLMGVVDSILKRKKDKTKFDADLFRDKEYFSQVNLTEIKSIKKGLDAVEDDDLRAILTSALLSVLVKVSYLKRSPDLKYRDDSDRVRPSANDEFRVTAQQFFSDILSLDSPSVGLASNFVGSAKNLGHTENGQVDLIITSPPYLNGTNYIRNTKLELWIGGFLTDDSGLKDLRCKEISCGINSAQRTTYSPTLWPKINQTIKV